MKKNFLFIKILLLLLIVNACSNDDDNSVVQELAVAFENPSVGFTTTDTSKEIKLVFSNSATENGTAIINYTLVNTEYGDDADFTTVPSGETGSITVNIIAGTNEATFTFNKLQNPIEGTTKSVTFSLASISIPDAKISGNTNLIVSYTEAPALGGVISPEIGGPNEPNQVYVDLSSQTQTAIKRDTWDLGFYSGSENRVVLNGSLAMAVAEIDFVDIDAVTEADIVDLQALVATGTFTPDNLEYVDAQNGDITGTAISEVSDVDNENKVYLLNLGSEVGTEVPELGGIDIFDDSRGWKKIRVLKNGADYILQYADLNATTHEEITISKNDDYNFTFFSFNSNSIINVEPEKDKWDLNFTVFTNEIPNYGSYIFSDFVVTNLKRDVVAYQVSTEDFSYEDFTYANVNSVDFENDQRAIGSQWRNGGGPGTLPSIKDDVFYILKDSSDNIYKIRFTALVDESGERGHSAFEYTLLQ